MKYRLLNALRPVGVAGLLPALMFLSSLVGFQAAHAQTIAAPPAAEMPANAHMMSYSDGWACDHGYRMSDGACVEISIPPNAYATSSNYGRAWDCDRGFRRTGNACVQILIPANAYLTSGAAIAASKRPRKSPAPQ